MTGAFFLAFLAAVANATSSLLQRGANKRKSNKPIYSMPLWFLGVGLALLSFVLQAIALSFGSLAAIEPILALELVLVVVGSGIFFRAHLGKQEWFSIGLMTVGTVGLVAALNPQKNDQVTISGGQWVWGLGITGGVIVGCALASMWIRRDEYRAALLGISTGFSFGLTSSLLKGAMLVFKQEGFGAAATAWQLYLALAVGIFTFWLLQMTLRSGKLIASQPGITLADPFVAIAWGGAIYAEKMSSGVLLFFASLAALLLIVGAILLAQAPALTEDG